jgi:hypothetical protein
MGVLFLFLFVTFYGGSQDASSYVYCAEIFPTGVRAQGLGTSIAGLFASTLLYTEAAPVAFADVGWKYYLVFILVPAALVPLQYICKFDPGSIFNKKTILTSNLSPSGDGELDARGDCREIRRRGSR